MEKHAISEQLNQLERERRNALFAATCALKRGDISAAIDAQQKALELEAEIAKKRLALFADTARQFLFPERNGHVCIPA